MGKIIELPPLDRPREKAIRYGIENLSDAELIALLLGSGYKGENVNEISSRLISQFNGLNNLSKIPLLELVKIKGIKTNKALILASVFELHKRLSFKESEVDEIEVNNDYLYTKYNVRLNTANQEMLILVLVNSKNHIVYETILYKGNSTKIIFSYKDIWRELLTHPCSGFYLIHNHPQGNAKASHADLVFTSEILREAQKVNVPLLDHLIIGENGYISILNLLKT